MRSRNGKAASTPRARAGVQGADVTSDIPYVMVVLQGPAAQEVFASAEGVRRLLSAVHATYGEVTLSLALVGFSRHLVNLERREHDAYVRRGAHLIGDGGH